MNTPAPLYTIGPHRLNHDAELKKDFDGDDRGILWIAEPPDPFSNYCVGVDASNGLTGWNRFSRTKGDRKTDNGAIVVLKTGYGDPGDPNFRKSIQVASYAAPVDPYDLATVVNAVGRLYAGRNEDNQALVIIEVKPGPGGATQHTLMERYGYTNLYRSQALNQIEQARTIDFGWTSTRQSMQHLWTRGLRAIHKRQIIFRSKFLVEEFANAEMDMVRLRGAGAAGHHDDAVTACLLAIWAAYNWSFDVTPDTTTRAQQNNKPEWQRTSISARDMYQQWDDLISNMMDGN